MATEKGQEFINKYKGTDCLRSSWEMMYKKGHITLEEFAECANLTTEEIEEYKNKIDNCSEKQPKTLDDLTKENEQLWETVQFLLKNNGFIPKEADNE